MTIEFLGEDVLIPMEKDGFMPPKNSLAVFLGRKGEPVKLTLKPEDGNPLTPNDKVIYPGEEGVPVVLVGPQINADPVAEYNGVIWRPSNRHQRKKEENKNRDNGYKVVRTPLPRRFGVR